MVLGCHGRIAHSQINIGCQDCIYIGNAGVDQIAECFQIIGSGDFQNGAVHNTAALGAVDGAFCCLAFFLIAFAGGNAAAAADRADRMDTANACFIGGTFQRMLTLPCKNRITAFHIGKAIAQCIGKRLGLHIGSGGISRCAAFIGSSGNVHIEIMHIGKLGSGVIEAIANQAVDRSALVGIGCTIVISTAHSIAVDIADIGIVGVAADQGRTLISAHILIGSNCAVAELGAHIANVIAVLDAVGFAAGGAGHKADQAAHSGSTQNRSRILRVGDHSGLCISCNIADQTAYIEGVVHADGAAVDALVNGRTLCVACNTADVVQVQIGVVNIGSTDVLHQADAACNGGVDSLCYHTAMAGVDFLIAADVAGTGNRHILDDCAIGGTKQTGDILGGSQLFACVITGRCRPYIAVIHFDVHTGNHIACAIKGTGIRIIQRTDGTVGVGMGDPDLIGQVDIGCQNSIQIGLAGIDTIGKSDQLGSSTDLNNFGGGFCFFSQNSHGNKAHDHHDCQQQADDTFFHSLSFLHFDF